MAVNRSFASDTSLALIHIMQPCTQQERIDDLTKQSSRVNLALFGNPDDPNDLGAIELIKEIHKTQLKMIPTYTEMDNWGTFFKKGREVGGFLVVFLLGSGVIVGTIYSIKSWFRK